MENVFINPSATDWNFILKRPAFETGLLEETVTAILEDVKLNGDDAVKKYAAKFDGVTLKELRVST
jgi:histidinol dehydrogenase